MSSTSGQIVQRTDITKKLNIPSKAIKRRVALVNLAVDASVSPNVAF